MSQISLIAKSELRSLIQVFTEPAHQNTLKLYARRLGIYASTDADYRLPTELQRVDHGTNNPPDLPPGAKKKRKEKC